MADGERARGHRPGRAVPTSRAGAEAAVLIAFVSLRAGTLVIILPSVGHSLRHAASAGADLVLLVLTGVESAVLCLAAVRSHRYLSAWWPWLDVVWASGVLIGELWYLHPADRVGTWTAWGGALSVNAVFGGALGFPRRWQTAAGTSAVAAAYLVSVSRTVGGSSMVASNMLSYVVFAVAARSTATYIRRLGRDADEAREQAALAARQAERDRFRLLVHDQATVLRMLSEPPADPVLEEALRRQAKLGAAQFQHLLGQPGRRKPGELPAADPAGVALVDLLISAGSGFGDLPIEYVVDLAAGVCLAESVASAVHAAVATLLHNVRCHAEASHVVIHADTLPGPGQWEVTVTDDGCGFDTAATPKRFGLTVQAGQALTARGVTIAVTSAPGHGTAATLRGPLKCETEAG